MINGSEIRSVLVDVTPYTFGVSAVGEIDGYYSEDIFVPIIRKNTPIPVTRSDVFYTAAHNQKAVDVRVFQGEHKDASNNLEVGRFRVEGLAKRPAGSEIIAKFALDSDGILQVSATEKDTGLEKTITIHNVLTEATADSLTQARQKIIELFDEDSTDSDLDSDDQPIVNQPPTKVEAGNSQHVQANALIDKARSMFDTVGTDDQEDMIDLIEAINGAITEDDTAQIQQLMDELSEIIFYIET